MSDLKAVLDAMLEVAKAASPVVGHGAPEVIALGERIVEMVDHATEAFKGEIPAQLPAQRELIEAAIRARVHQTAEMLRGHKPASNAPHIDRSGKEV